MAQRIVVSVPHHLGVDEARRRLDGRAEWAKQRLHREGARLAIDEWHDNDRAFTAHAFGQRVRGVVAVAETHVRFAIEVPWVLGMFASKIEAAAKHYAARLMA